MSVANVSGSPRATYGINGGFSLRRRSWMIRCCRVSINELKYNNYLHMRNIWYLDSEDVFFQNAVDYLDGAIPKLSKCYEFCLQTTPFNELKNPIKSFAVHSFNRCAFIGIKEKFTEIIDIINKNTEELDESMNAPTAPLPVIRNRSITSSSRNSRGNPGTQGGTILRLD